MSNLTCAQTSWSARWLIIFSAIGLIVTGATAVVRVFSFGRGSRATAPGTEPAA